MFKRDDWLFGLVSLFVGGTVLFFIQDLKGIKAADPAGPIALPAIIAWAMIGIGCIHVLAALRIIRNNPNTAVAERKSIKPVALICLICSIYAIGLEYCGYIIMTPFLIASVMVSVGMRDLKKIAATSVFTMIILFVVFFYGLQVKLPLGPFQNLFM